MANISYLTQAIERAIRDSAPVSTGNPRSDFYSHLVSLGYQLDPILKVGGICRIQGPADKQGKKNGWYVYHESNDPLIGFARYGYWKTGEDFKWSSKQERFMSAAETVAFYESMEKAKLEYESAKLLRQEEAAIKSKSIWDNAQPADPQHPYIIRKQIECSDIRQSRNKLIIPVRSPDGDIVSLQFIDEDGNKKFKSGGRIQGCYHVIEGNDLDVYVAEGYATGRTINAATGATVFVAFNAGNIYEVTSHVKNLNYPRITIAADNDFNTKGNPGITKAQQAAAALGVDVVWPDDANDYNDLGVEKTRSALIKSPQVYVKPQKEKQEIIEPPAGVLRDVYNYYNATSGNDQRGFAVQTALAFGSIALARSFKTSYDNYSSIYLLNVGKSGTGKEHAKTVVERVMQACGLGDLIAGDGYKSAGGVFSELLERPRHINIIDEFGRYLEAGRDLRSGNQNTREANTKLMESIGRAHGVMRPPSYSTMTLKKDVAKDMRNRIIYNPAITLLTMTTPDTLFKTIDMGAIKDGFVNRFIISISDAPRSIRKHMPPLDVPQSIIDWYNVIESRAPGSHYANEPAKAVIIDFDDDAMRLQNDFQQFCIEKADELEKFGMAELPGRSNEMAMRLSLIVALARDPMAEYIGHDDMLWAIEYIKACLMRTISELKLTISSSEYEGHKKEILADLRNRGEDGITWSAMQKNAPYSKHKMRDLKDILQSLKDSELIIDEPFKGVGRPTTKWTAIA